jgi:tetratricopeptide (TPR) repeat protein
MRLRETLGHFWYFRFVFLCLGTMLALLMLALSCFFPISTGSSVGWALFGSGLALLLFLGVFSHWNRRAFKFQLDVTKAQMFLDKGRHADAQSHAQSAWQYANVLPLGDPDRADSLRVLTRVAAALGNNDDAESFGQQWLAAAEEAWGSGSWRIINPLQELAEIYIEIVRYAQAKPLLARAWLMLDRKPIQYPLAFGWCLQLSGRLHLELGQFDRAEEILRRAFERLSAEQIWRDHPLIAFDFIVVLAQNNKPDAAESILQVGQDLVQKTYPAESCCWPTHRCASRSNAGPTQKN